VTHRAPQTASGQGLRLIVGPRRKGLWRGAEEFFEFVAKVGMVGEMEIGDDGLARVALGEEFPGQAAAEFACPGAWGFAEAPAERALELAERHRGERGQGRSVEFGLLRELFPILNAREPVADLGSRSGARRG